VLSVAIGGFQDSVDQAHLVGQMPTDDYQRATGNVIKLLTEGRHFNSLVAAWPAGTPVPQAVIDSSHEIAALLTSTLDLIPITNREVVTARALAIEQAVITVLALRQ
jgi:hypothetical protein